MTISTSATAFSSLPKRLLGRTGLEVTALGFGSAPLGDIYEVLDDATAIAATTAVSTPTLPAEQEPTHV